MIFLSRPSKSYEVGHASTFPPQEETGTKENKPKKMEDRKWS